MSTPVQKPKFAQRLIRALFNGNVIGFLLFWITYFLAIAVNGLASSTVFNPIYVGLFNYAIGLSSSIGIELSKDMS